MPYVTDMTSIELRQHMKMLLDHPGWNDPLTNRLWKEIQEQDKIESDLLEALEAIVAQDGYDGLDYFVGTDLSSRIQEAITKAKGDMK